MYIRNYSLLRSINIEVDIEFKFPRFSFTGRTSELGWLGLMLSCLLLCFSIDWWQIFQSRVGDIFIPREASSRPPKETGNYVENFRLPIQQ